MDALVLRERIEKTIELGESQFREFKSAYHGEPGRKRPRDTSSVAKDIAEALVAFANADGGELLVGVEDAGLITGVPYSPVQVEILLNSPKTGVHAETPLPALTAVQVQFGEAAILYFAVDKGSRYIHQTSDGRCLQRRDLESAPVSTARLQFERQEQLSREYDRAFVEGADVTALDLDLVRTVAQGTSRMSPEKSLQYWGLAEFGMGVLRLRRAALLLFARDANHWHPRCQVRVIRVRGTELKTGRDYNVASDETVTGNILQLLTRSWEQLRPHLVQTRLSEGALFREQVMYPEDAVREALINAITHRDYSFEGKNIEITIFDDRMTIQSPGALLSSIRVEDLRNQKGAHESRNAHIARVLREIGYVREMGEGMRRMFRLMNDADLVPPQVNSEHGHFTVALSHKSVFSPADQAWLAGYRALRLTREEMLVAMLGRNGELVSPQQVYNVLGLHDWDVYRAVFEQLSFKEVIHNTLSEAQKRKSTRGRRKGTSYRDVPRLAIRQPAVLEEALSTMFAALSRLPAVGQVDGHYIEGLLAALPTENVYKTTVVRLIRLLRTLGLLDSENLPSPTLIELWRQGETMAAERLLDSLPIAANSKGRTLKAPTKVAGRGVAGEPEEIYVGNLAYEATEEALRALFAPFGAVRRVRAQPDYLTGKGRGFAFVAMSDRAAASTAIEALEGSEFMGRPLRLGWAR